VALSDDELRRLPYPALIYLAACCAKRVEPLYEHCWNGAPRFHARAVRDAIDAATRNATAPSMGTHDETAEAVNSAGRAAAEAAMAADTSGAPAAAVHAADAAAELAYAVNPARDRGVAVRAAKRVIHSSAQACAHVVPGLDRRLVEAVSSDMHVLGMHASLEGWSDAQRIPCVLQFKP
jgi:hypothetical protein